MVSPAVAQAILNQPTPDILGQFRSGQEFQRQSQVRKFAGMASEGDQEAMEQLRGLDPQVALQMQQVLGAKDQAALAGFVQDAKVLEGLLSSGNNQGAMAFANSRLDALKRMGRNTAQTERILEVMKSDPNAALQEVKAFTGTFEQAKNMSQPSSVQETEWFLQQAPEVQEQHLRLKRRQDPTLAEKLEEARRKSEISVQETEGKESVKLRVKAADEAASQALEAEAGLPVYDQMIAEIDAGAQTSALAQYFPTVQDATRRFEQGARQLGLGVISATTFGALSETELKVAMETAVPKLSPPAMRKWLEDKRNAQAKLAQQMHEYAQHLEEGGTKVQWIRKQRDIRKAMKDEQPDQSPQAAPQQKAPVDINALVNKYRSQ